MRLVIQCVGRYAYHVCALLDDGSLPAITGATTYWAAMARWDAAQGAIEAGIAFADLIGRVVRGGDA
jgi:hypothetical protein